MVTGLNAPASSGAGGYSWQTVWVAGLDGEVSASLTPDDRDLLKLAGEHDALGTERPIGVFFSFIFNLPGARAASDDLRTLGWPSAGVTEEATGDKCWHVYAHRRRLVLSEESIIQLPSRWKISPSDTAARLTAWTSAAAVGCAGQSRANYRLSDSCSLVV